MRVRAIQRALWVIIVHDVGLAAIFVIARTYLRITHVKGLGFGTEQSRHATSAVQGKRNVTRMSRNATIAEHTTGSASI